MVGLIVAGGVLMAGCAGYIGYDQYNQRVLKPKKAEKEKEKKEMERGIKYYNKLYTCSDNDCGKHFRLYQSMMYYVANNTSGCPHCRASLGVQDSKMKMYIKEKDVEGIYKLLSVSQATQIVNEEYLEAFKYSDMCPTILDEESYKGVNGTIDSLYNVSKQEREDAIRGQFAGQDTQAWYRNISNGAQKKVSNRQEEMVGHTATLANIVNGREVTQEEKKEEKKNNYIV